MQRSDSTRMGRKNHRLPVTSQLPQFSGLIFDKLRQDLFGPSFFRQVANPARQANLKATTGFLLSNDVVKKSEGLFSTSHDFAVGSLIAQPHAPAY